MYEGPALYIKGQHYMCPMVLYGIEYIEKLRIFRISQHTSSSIAASAASSAVSICTFVPVSKHFCTSKASEHLLLQHRRKRRLLLLQLFDRAPALALPRRSKV